MAPRTPPFAGAGTSFSYFLERTGKAAGLGDRRFLARNFLLDEGVVETRLGSYALAGAAEDHADVSAWTGRHEDYLRSFVFLTVKPLKEARAARLLAVRVMSGRDDYAAATDGDLA